jgi:Membrane protein of unknown function.
MLRFLIRLLVNSLALAVAVWIVPGLTMVAYAQGEPLIAGGPSLELLVSYVFIAFVFGLINGIVGNAIRIVAFPLYVLTLGLIALVVNALLLLLVTLVSQWLALGFSSRTSIGESSGLSCSASQAGSSAWCCDPL